MPADGACEEAADLARQSGDNFALGRALHAWPAGVGRGELGGALRLFQESRQAIESVGADYYTASLTTTRACVLRKLGRVEGSPRAMSMELQQRSRTAPRSNLVQCVEDYAAVLAGRGFARFAPAAGRMRRRTRTLGTAEIKAGTRNRRRPRSGAVALTPTEWDDAYARGRSMTVIDALKEAISSTTDLRV